MRAEFFDFKPTHKLWLSTNHKPEIRGTDHAIWRRIRLVPWSVTIPPAEKDKKLPEKLRRELAGVLAWAVRGCLDWQRDGLGESEEVRQATQDYRDEMDVLAGFIEDRCVVSGDARAGATALYQEYAAWRRDSGENEETQKRFGTRLSERGFIGGKGRSGPLKNRKVWYGIGLRFDRPDPGVDGGPSPDDRLPDESGLSKPETTNASSRGRPSETLKPHKQLKNHSRGGYTEVRSTSSTSSTVAGENDAGDAMNRRVLEALRGPSLAPMVVQYFEGKAGRDDLAGAVAAHYRDGGRWEDWREPTVRALTALEETRGRDVP
jgi:phage/plasmid-associated DNA primase